MLEAVGPGSEHFDEAHFDEAHFDRTSFDEAVDGIVQKTGWRL
jgi:hypothetical protein